MTRQILILGSVLLALLILGGGGLFAYNYFTTDIAPPKISYIASGTYPDNSVLAGPVQQKTENSITVVKQDGKSITISIAPSTHILIQSDTSSSSIASISDIGIGKMVLITPSTSDATVAESIIIVAPPPVASTQ